jgi:geranylgeranyl reductase family protein
VWDAVVVGAGPAGCAAAYDLAAAGRRVLLVDRAVFPRAKACAGGLTLKAIRALRYPVDPVVRRWVREIVLEEGAGSAVRVGRRSPVCAMTVRAELDSYCLEQTLARGVSFLRVGGLKAVEQGTDGVTLRFADAEGLTARFAVGADGVHSRMRVLTTDGSWFRSGFALEANVPYRADGEQYPLCFDFAAVAGGYGWLFPRDNHVNVGLYTAAASGSGQTGLDGAALERYIETRCGVGRAHGRVVGQFLGLGAAKYRPKADARVLLVGDAAGCVDPLTGEGIYGAIRSGQAAAAAIDGALGAQGGWKERGGTRLPNGMAAAEGFLREMERMRADLNVAEHAAERFYAEPARGFALMRLPLMRRVVLRAYGEGLSLAGLLRVVRVAAGVRGRLVGRAG